MKRLHIFFVRVAMGALLAILSLSCDDGQTGPAPEPNTTPNAAPATGVQGRQYPNPEDLPQVQVELGQGEVQQAPATSQIDVEGLMSVVRCDNWLIATDAQGRLLRFKRGAANEEFVARNALSLPGLVSALSCGDPGEVLLAIGSMLVRISLDDGHLQYQSLQAKYPRGLARLVDGRLAILDAGKNKQVWLIDAQSEAQIIQVSSGTRAIAADPLGGFVGLDAETKTVQFYQADGSLGQAFSRAGSGSHDLDVPSAISVSDDKVIIADSRRSLVLSFSRAGEPTGRYGENAQGLRELALPTAVAVDGASLWVASRLNGQLRRYDLR